MMHITYGTEREHAAALRRGLQCLGKEFLAEVCWWCDGTGTREFECCSVCGKGRPYGTALGLLTSDSRPAPESVVNQVLVASERARLCIVAP
jgi:hypothetical protein